MTRRVRRRWFPNRFVAQLSFGSNPVLDIASLFTAAQEIQRISSASDLVFRRFSKFDHGNLLVRLSLRSQTSRCPTKQYARGHRPTPVAPATSEPAGGPCRFGTKTRQKRG